MATSPTQQIGTAGFGAAPGSNIGEQYVTDATGRNVGVSFDSLDKTIFGYGRKAAEPYLQNTGKGIFTAGTPAEYGEFGGGTPGTPDSWSNPDMWYFNPPETFFNTTDSAIQQGSNRSDGGGWEGNDGGWTKPWGSFVESSYSGGGDNEGIQYNPGGYSPNFFKTQNELQAALDASDLFTYEGADYYGNSNPGSDLRRMNTYGQMLAGDPVVTDAQSWRDSGQNNSGYAPVPITGRKALAGAETVMDNGRVSGYRINTNHPWSESVVDNNGSTRSASYLNWQPNDIDLFNKQTSAMGDGYRFLPVGSMDAFTGYKPGSGNANFQFKQQEKSHSMFGGLGPILSIASMIGKLIPGPWTPFAYGYDALSAMESKNPFKLASTALGAAGAFGGDMFGDMGGGFSDMAGFDDYNNMSSGFSDAAGFDDYNTFGLNDAAGFDDYNTMANLGNGGGAGNTFTNGAWTDPWADQAMQLFDQAGMPGYTQYGQSYGNAAMEKLGNAASSIGPMDLAKGAMSIGSGVLGYNRSRQIEEAMRKSGKRADPWGTSGGRALADTQLQELMRNPSQVSGRDPSYGLRMQGAQRANVTRGSGAMAVAGANASTDWYNQRMQALGGLAGAPGDPSARGRMEASGYNMGNDLAGQSLASIGYGISRFGGAGQDMPPEVQQWLMRQQMGARG